MFDLFKCDRNLFSKAFLIKINPVSFFLAFLCLTNVSPNQFTFVTITFSPPEFAIYILFHLTLLLYPFFVFFSCLSPNTCISCQNQQKPRFDCRILQMKFYWKIPSCRRINRFTQTIFVVVHSPGKSTNSPQSCNVFYICFQIALYQPL